MFWKVLVLFSPNLHQWLIMGGRWMHYILRSKGQSSRSRWNNICWNRHCTGGGIQYSTCRVELRPSWRVSVTHGPSWQAAVTGHVLLHAKFSQKALLCDAFPDEARRDGSCVAGPVKHRILIKFQVIYRFHWHQNPTASQVRHPVLIYCCKCSELQKIWNTWLTTTLMKPSRSNSQILFA